MTLTVVRSKNTGKVLHITCDCHNISYRSFKQMDEDEIQHTGTMETILK